VASHVLGLIARRIRSDLPAPRTLARQAGWQAKYGHPVHALETFVDRSRFRGTCYRAANWVKVGQSTGRTRNDVLNRGPLTSVKDVYVYPLVRDFRRALGLPAEASSAQTGATPCAIPTEATA
jgi:hypothetical protein